MPCIDVIFLYFTVGSCSYYKFFILFYIFFRSDWKRNLVLVVKTFDIVVPLYSSLKYMIMKEETKMITFGPYKLYLIVRASFLTQYAVHLYTHRIMV